MADMPEISRFLGIVVGMFAREHPPPHFHAVYGEYHITIDIKTGVVRGHFPKRALRLVLEWMECHEDELMQNWDMLQSGKTPNPIKPLE